MPRCSSVDRLISRRLNKTVIRAKASHRQWKPSPTVSGALSRLRPSPSGGVVHKITPLKQTITENKRQKQTRLNKEKKNECRFHGFGRYQYLVAIRIWSLSGFGRYWDLVAIGIRSLSGFGRCQDLVAIRLYALSRVWTLTFLKDFIPE